MKLFTKKNLIQKMTIVLVILMLFNFIMPNFVRAETAIETAGKVILTPIRGFFVMCGDAVMNGLQYLLKVNEKAVIPYSDQVEESKQFLGQENIGENPVEQVIENSVVGDILLDMDGFTTGQDKPNFKYTPKFIFENKVKSFDINFISPPKATSTEKTNEEKNKGTSSLSGEKWYENYVFVVGKCQERYNNAKGNSKNSITPFRSME